MTAMTMSGPHAAKYLILLKSETAARALLFGGDHRYLAELIDDDGLMLDNLIRAGTQCATPGELSLECLARLSQPTAGEHVQCFSLG